jgi:hypothetical protein
MTDGMDIYLLIGKIKKPHEERLSDRECLP